jgi:hypothetical protein
LSGAKSPVRAHLHGARGRGRDRAGLRRGAGRLAREGHVAPDPHRLAGKRVGAAAEHALDDGPRGYRQLSGREPLCVDVTEPATRVRPVGDPGQRRGRRGSGRVRACPGQARRVDGVCGRALGCAAIERAAGEGERGEDEQSAHRAQHARAARARREGRVN